MVVIALKIQKMVIHLISVCKQLLRIEYLDLIPKSFSWLKNPM